MPERLQYFRPGDQRGEPTTDVARNALGLEPMPQRSAAQQLRAEGYRRRVRAALAFQG